MKRLFSLTVLLGIFCAAAFCHTVGCTPFDLLSIFTEAIQEQLTLEQPQKLTSPAPEAAQNAAPIPAQFTHAVWVATAYAIDYPATQTVNEAQLKSQCDTILDTIKAAGADTVYFQVRPSADAFYPSKLFPWSKYLTGKSGTAPENGFDPLAYWIEQAHNRGLKLEAWLNPYRVCGGAYAEQDFTSLPSSSPAKQHPEWVIAHDGNYYFNPGLPEVRQLICDGILEIVQKYEVDGIQFDDYFYPSESFDDAETYAAAKSNLSLADWRRENVNQLVEQAGKIIHANRKNPNCRFGISPSGIWQNQSSLCINGSRTKGYAHYSEAFADSLTWIKNGWIDYICPQIYWEIGDTAADFDTLVQWWNKQVENTSVELLIGLAAYKIGDESYGNTWRYDGCAEISRQLSLLHSLEHIKGWAVFSYRDLIEIDGLSAALQADTQ